MKKLTSLICVLVMLFSCFSMVANAGIGDNEFTEREPNNSMSTADRIYNDYTVWGSAGASDLDYFKFTLSSKAKVNVLCQSTRQAVLMGIWDSSDEIVAAGSSSYSNGYYYDEIYNKTLSAGTYYIIIFQESGYSTSASYLFYFDYETTGTSHTHSYSQKVTAPTCTAQGYTTYTCSCGDSYKSNYTSATGHTAVTATGYAATCVQTGLTDGESCSVCGAVITAQQTIPALGHSWSEWEVVIAPDVGVQGLNRRTCNVCGTVEEAVTDAGFQPGETEHNYVETIVPATTTADGYKNYECQNCGNVYSEPIAMIDTVTLSSTNVVYNGKVRTPGVTVTDANGNTLVKDVDYTVEYAADMKMPGIYEVTVTFMGNYAGTEALSFTIAPKATTGVKASTVTSSAITLTWTKTEGATGYRVYQYSSSSGEYVLKKSVTSTSYKVTGLKGNTSYKFKIRPYTKTADGTVIWGADSSVLTAKTKAANSVNITADSATIYVGGSKTLKATVVPSGTTVTWKSSDTSIAKVSSTGKVTAVKKGTATITAYYKLNGKTYKDTCKITVKNPSITLSKTSATLYTYSTLTLKATTAPSDLTVKWTSSDTKIAKVSSSGKVTPVKAGTAKITASFTYGGKTYKSVCTVTVKKQDPIKIEYVDWEVNSVDGIEPSIKITNNTNKDITRIVITTEYRDRYGDPAYCEVRNSYTRDLVVTSGLKAKSTNTFYWGAAVYNRYVHRIDIEYAVITFSDGTEITQDIYRYWYDSYYYG